MLIVAMPSAVFSQTAVTAYGTVTDNGSNLPWRLYDDGTLIVDSGFIEWRGGTPAVSLTSPWNEHRYDIYKIIFTGPITAGESLIALFGRLENVTTIEGLYYFDTSKTTDMRQMFNLMYNIASLDLSSWDTGNVTHMSSMFSVAFRLTSLNVSGWNTSNVTDMNQMFRSVGGLTSLDLSSWDVSSVRDMSGMFYNTRSLTHLDTSGWDTGNLRDMSAMFAGVDSLTTLDLSHFDTRNVTNMSGMFDRTNLTTLDLSYFDTRNVTNMSDMFISASNLTNLDVSGWDVSSVRDMSDMFRYTISLTDLDLSSWDVSNVRNMSNMFWGTGLTNLDLSSWDTGNVTDMSLMFIDTKNLINLDISGFDTNRVTSMSRMFRGAYPLRYLTLGENFEFSLFWSPFANSYFDVDLPPAYWQNVGTGTVDNPLGEFVFTSEALMRYYDGAIHADTWVRQPRVPDEITVRLSGVFLPLDIIVENGRTLVPFHAISHAMAADVDWNGETQTAIAELREMTIELTIGSAITYVNGQPIELDVSPRIIDNRTFVPLRFVAENFGFYVEWNEDTKTISIN